MDVERRRLEREMRLEVQKRKEANWEARRQEDSRAEGGEDWEGSHGNPCGQDKDMETERGWKHKIS